MMATTGTADASDPAGQILAPIFDKLIEGQLLTSQDQAVSFIAQYDLMKTVTDTLNKLVDPVLAKQQEKTDAQIQSLQQLLDNAQKAEAVAQNARARIIELEKELQELHAQLSASSNNQSSLLKGIKIEKPQKYGGQRNATVIDSWIFAMEKYVEAQISPNMSTVQKDKLTFTVATQYFKDEALNWYRHLCLNGERDPAWAISTWSDLKRMLKSEFYPLDAFQKVREKLSRLRQYKSVSEYNNVFRKLILQIPDMEESEQLGYYLPGLKHNTQAQTKSQLQLLTRLGQDAGIQTAMQLAEIHDDASFNGSNWKNKNGSKTNGVAPMEIDNVDKKFKKKWLTPAEKAQHIRDNLCFKCHQKRHGGPCPSKKSISNVEMQTDDSSVSSQEN